jgi:hypothetical protein
MKTVRIYINMDGLRELRTNLRLFVKIKINDKILRQRIIAILYQTSKKMFHESTKRYIRKSKL